MRIARVLIACLGLGAASTAMADQDGRYRLPWGGFGVPVFGQRQSLPSDAMQEARELGLFEEALSIRSGWIDKVARITGRLDVMTARRNEDGDAVSYACTGTAITDRLILTNAHCVNKTGKERAISILFLPNFRDARRKDAVEALPVALRPVESGEINGLDYAILELQAPIKDYEPPQFALRDPGPGEPLVVIGHPEGQPLHLSRGRCQSDGEYPVDGTDVVHNCATLAGSSGSLVFTSEGQVVGLHFLGGQTFGGREINRAVRMAALVENSNFLDEIFGKGPSTSGDQACQRITVPDGFTCTQENGDIRIVAEAGSAIFHMRPGEKLPQEWERARALCMLDEIEICTHLGAAFQYGIEVEKDIVRARLLYAHACNYGDRNACSNLGELYEKGLGVERDVDRAISIYDQSCPDRNFSEGADCFNLGRFLP